MTTNTDHTHRPITLWARDGQWRWILPAAARAGLPIAAVGGPDLDPRRAAELHTQLDAEPIEDLARTLRAAADSAVLLAARPPSEVLEWIESRGAAELARRSVRLVSLPPLPSSSMSPLFREPADEALPVVAPLLSRAPLGASLRDALASFGTVQTALFAARGSGDFGGLGARLLDALDLLGGILGEPETIDGAVAAPRAPSGVRAAPTDDLTLLRGSLTAHLRFESEASAVLSLSDQAGRWFRGLSLAGDAGLIRFDDQGFEWIGPDGSTIERTEAPDHADPASALADQVFDALRDTDTPARAPRARAAAAAGALILSARTGQPESPATIRRMANIPA